jgi:hypothetical protein
MGEGVRSSARVATREIEINRTVSVRLQGILRREAEFLCLQIGGRPKVNVTVTLTSLFAGSSTGWMDESIIVIASLLRSSAMRFGGIMSSV